MVHDDPDDELAARLDSALRTGLGSTSVDVVALLDGSRRRARRVRSQRLAAVVAAAVLVVAVPLSYEVIRPDPNGVVQPAALMPSSSLTQLPDSGLPAAAPTQTPSPIAVRPTTPVPISTSVTTKSRPPTKATLSAGYRIPDSVAFSAAELPDGSKLNLDLDTGTKTPTSMGQVCDPGNPKGARPITSRQWGWAVGDAMTATTVNLVVTGWKSGTGKLAFDQLVTDTGFCQWDDPQTEVDFSTTLSDQSWSGTSVSSVNSSLKYGRAVVRLGDVIAAVEVQDASGTDVALKLADRLAVVSCRHLQSSGLAAVK
jgi:hypothetical protein